MWSRALPSGLSFAGGMHAADVSFIADTTWIDPDGIRQSRQEIFDSLFDLIRGARRLVLLDMFLYNDFRMRVSEPHRPLAQQLTETLIRKKDTCPEITIVVITDPINTVYGSVPSAEFSRLSDAGVSVVVTNLRPLRDSNPAYSLIWRLLFRPLGNSGRGSLPNPFDEPDRVTLRTYLEMLNFKANHRKVVIADRDDDLVGLVTSANPHNASSAHTNVAIRFSGAAANDLVATENTVLELCGHEPLPYVNSSRSKDSEVSVQVLTEYAIKKVALQLIDEAQANERLDLAAFYLSDRRIIEALKQARHRGVALRVLLDPNIDAFGHSKFGVPNRPVAAELRRAGVEVRWSHTHGEQCHAKMLLGINADGEARLLLGSANLTRRNLDNFNLETNVLVRSPRESQVCNSAGALFDQLWFNRPGQNFTVPYEFYRNESMTKRWLYRFMEATGFCTF